MKWSTSRTKLTLLNKIYKKCLNTTWTCSWFSCKSDEYYSHVLVLNTFLLLKLSPPYKNTFKILQMVAMIKSILTRYGHSYSTERVRPNTKPTMSFKLVWNEVLKEFGSNLLNASLVSIFLIKVFGGTRAMTADNSGCRLIQSWLTKFFCLQSSWDLSLLEIQFCFFFGTNTQGIDST